MEPILFLEMPKMPSERKNYQWGSSMELLKKFIDFLDKEADNISEIYLSMRMYNNGVLHEKMEAFANRGIKVTVISIPLIGYSDGYPGKIYKYETGDSYRDNATKYSLAEEIYKDIEKLNSENYILRIFDHTYVGKFSNYARYAQFSLNTNSIYIKYKDGRKTVTGLTSSNLAVKDKPVAAFMLLVENSPASRETTEKFFSNLLKYSVKPSDWQDSHPDYCYEMETADDGDDENIEMNYFTAPFILNSPIKIEQKITDIISNARERIYICAEELTAFNYRDINGEKRSGILGAIIEKCKRFEQSGQRIEVKCLSRTYVNLCGPWYGSRKPKYSDNFKSLIRKVNQFRSCSYSVNKYVNAKFIVVDNIIIVGTSDYTPTEFLYGDVEDNFRYISYRGKCSEVTHYIIIEDSGLSEQLIRFFNEIIARSDTYVHGTADVGTGTWNGEKVKYEKVWKGHTFTTDEIKKLLAGEEIILMGIKGSCGPYNVRGKFRKQPHKSCNIVGFESLETSNLDNYPDKYCVGTWGGTEVRFEKTCRNHTFTNEECAKLLAGEVIKFPAKTKNGIEYTEKGKLGNIRVYKGYNEVEFLSECAFKKKIYAVKSGRKTGIFNEYSKCSEQIDKYPNAKFHGFEYRSELGDESEDVSGSLRYAIKEAEKFLGDLVYLGESADYLKDVSWVEDGFLPFGNK